MQLMYRGINYQCQSLPRQNSDISGRPGKYRSVTYYISPKTVVSYPSLIAYKYRGVDYIKGSCR